MLIAKVATTWLSLGVRRGPHNPGVVDRMVTEGYAGSDMNGLAIIDILARVEEYTRLKIILRSRKI